MGASPTAMATLGEAESTTQTDSLRMAARRHMTRGVGYAVHRLAMPDGSVVNEYVGGGGVVFAVSWRTLYKPDLTALLGASYSDYATAQRRVSDPTLQRRNFRHTGADLVVQSRSYLHVFSGVAYRPSLVPSGVNLDQVQ